MDQEQSQQRIRAGEALRIARTVKKLSRRELALASGLEAWEITRFESGERPLTAEETHRLWAALSS